MNKPGTFLLLVILSTGLVFAAEAIDWNALSPEQQEVLKPLRGKWGELSPERQASVQRGAERWSKLTPDERAQMQKRFERWQGLPETERQRIRERYEQFRTLTPDQQERLRRRHEWFTRKTQTEQQELRQRYQDMSPEERRRALDEVRKQRQRELETEQQQRRSIESRQPQIRSVPQQRPAPTQQRTAPSSGRGGCAISLPLSGGGSGRGCGGRGRPPSTQQLRPRDGSCANARPGDPNAGASAAVNCRSCAPGRGACRCSAVADPVAVAAEHRGAGRWDPVRIRGW
jgi:flagellar motility protein MotE (MotC chaperone)